MNWTRFVFMLTWVPVWGRILILGLIIFVGRLIFLEIIFPLYYYFMWVDFSFVVFNFNLFFSGVFFNYSMVFLWLLGIFFFSKKSFPEGNIVGHIVINVLSLMSTVDDIMMWWWIFMKNMHRNLPKAWEKQRIIFHESSTMQKHHWDQIPNRSMISIS